MKLANQIQLSEAVKNEWDIPQEDIDEGFVPTSFGPCFNCGKQVSDYDFCYGCHAFVYKECNVNKDACGEHNKLEHLTQPIN